MASDDAIENLKRLKAESVSAGDVEKLPLIDAHQNAIDKHEENIQIRSLRDTFARQIYFLVKWSVVMTFVILILEGSGMLMFHLSESILMMLLGTTLVEILGLLYVIVRYLFDGKKGEEKQ